MKKLTITLAILFFTLISFADYTGNIEFSQRDLNFSTLDGYDVVSLNNASYTEIVGAPQLPVVTKRFVIPANENFVDLIITGSNSIQLNGNYNIYPV
ncbi:MAG: hypothetical protein U9N51_10370 [Bacteroidota bacterium]|nr:hypothetical protein [Bacteroidota bacterium]